MGNVWTAAADNKVSVIEEFLNNGGDANIKDENGYTPIHAAASYGHLDLVKMLLEKGGNINIQDNEGDTPLHHVEDLRSAIYLVKEAGADLSIKNHDGLTAAQFIEDDGEFPAVAKYLDGMAQGVDLEVELIGEQLKQEEAEAEALKLRKRLVETRDEVPELGVQYTVENEDEMLEMLEEKRREIEAILNSENPEEGLRNLIEKAVLEGMLNYQGDNSNKRVKGE